MSLYRIALANLSYPATPDESLDAVTAAIGRAAEANAGIVCFPECFLPGYRASDRALPPADAVWLDAAWAEVARSAAQNQVAVVLGTERVAVEGTRATAIVFGPDGNLEGFQDKVQIDPSEEGTYTPGAHRQLFRVGDLRFGIAICHEGWRYPETVRWAATRGAQLVFHPHFHERIPGALEPTAFGQAGNTFHEQSMRCRAAENSIFFASVNYASPGSPTTSAVIDPDGEALAWQPYGLPGLLIADLDLDRATGLLASRLRATD